MNKNNDVLNVIIAAQKGDERAWSNLVSRYSINVWSAISKYYSFSTQDKEDIVQDVFLRLLKSIKSYNPDKSNFSTFITTITKRVCIDKLRRDSVRSEETYAPDELLKVASVYPSVQEEIDGKYTFAELNKILKRLSAEKRLVFKLFYFKGLSYKQIADIMHRKIDWVKNTLHRSRIFIQNAFEKLNVIG